MEVRSNGQTVLSLEGITSRPAISRSSSIEVIPLDFMDEINTRNNSLELRNVVLFSTP